MPFDENSVVLFPLHEQEIKVLQYHVSQIWPKTNKQTKTSKENLTTNLETLSLKLAPHPIPFFSRNHSDIHLRIATILSLTYKEYLRREGKYR